MNTKRQRVKASNELTAATGRVGLQVEDRARWLVEFARRRRTDETRLLEGESLAARWEALAFAYGRRWFVDQKAKPPAWADVTTAYGRLWSHAFSLLRQSQPISAHWVGHLYPQPDGSVRALTYTADLPFLGAFMVQVYEVLRGLTSVRLRIRFCPICTRPFVSKRPDAKVCPIGSCRTLAWRKRHKEKFKATRREAYHRQMQKKTGNRNVLIGGPKKKIQLER